MSKPDISIIKENQEVVPEKRKGLTRKKKAEILAADPICPICEQEIACLSDAEFDHTIPLELGGKHELSNIRALHVNCHRIKTDADAKSIAKARRIRKRRTGQSKPKRKIKSRGFAKKKRTETIRD